MRSSVLMGALLCVLTTHAYAEQPIPPGLQHVMAEGAGRVANMTCADVRAVVAIVGAVKAEASARAAGASDRQITDAKRCLK